MKNFFEKLIVRIVYYYLIVFCWFWYAVPALWIHSSSFALESMFVISVLIIISMFYFENALSEKKKEDKSIQ